MGACCRGRGQIALLDGGEFRLIGRGELRRPCVGVGADLARFDEADPYADLRRDRMQGFVEATRANSAAQ
jgi:hypothetical protein